METGSKEEKEYYRNKVKEGWCSGSCSTHEGTVVLVRVISAAGYSWGYFAYCENAIKADEADGFTVKRIP